MSERDMNESFRETLTAAKNAIRMLGHQYPGMRIWTLLIILNFVTAYFRFEGTGAMILLGLLVLLTSIIIYTKTRSYPDTALNFMIGLLTILTVEWTAGKTVIFIMFYLVFNVLWAFIASVRLASDLEDILIQAARSAEELPILSAKNLFSEIVHKDTPYKRIGVEERAKALRYMVFRKVPTNLLPEMIRLVESITVVYCVQLDRACDFAFSLILMSMEKGNLERTLTNLRKVFETARKLPLLPEEAVDLVIKTRSLVTSGRLTVTDYTDVLDTASEGYLNAEEIASILNNISEQRRQVATAQDQPDA